MLTSDRIGRYRIIEELGRGAMGVVYRAEDTVIQRPVALKVVTRPGPKSGPHEHEAFERFLREARAAGSLLHQNVVAVFDVGEDEENRLSYIAMEFVDGEPLDSVLRRREPLSIERICSIGSQVCSALELAHAAGVVHRDIKPANLIVNGQGIVKVADFGIAKIVDAQMTQDGTFLGSPNYMSPEQVRSSTVDHRSDIFSLGIVLYELATLKRAFPGKTVYAVIQSVASDTPPLVRTVRPDLPPALEAAIAKAMAKPPGERFADAASMKRALDAALTAGAGDVSDAAMVEVTGEDIADAIPTMAHRGAPGRKPARSPAPPPAPTARNATRSIAIAAVVSVVAIVGALAMRGGSSDGAEAGATVVDSNRVDSPSVDPGTVAGADVAPDAVEDGEGGEGGEQIDEPAGELVSEEFATDVETTNTLGEGELAANGDVAVEPLPEPTATPSTAATAAKFPYVFKVKHRHGIGDCEGVIRVYAGSLEYDSSDHNKDDRVWIYSALRGASFDSDGTLRLMSGERGKTSLGLARKKYAFIVKSGRLPGWVIRHLSKKVPG